MKSLARFPKPLIFLLLAFLLLWAFLSKEAYPTWDAAFYYAYTRSLAFDGDLKIANDLKLSYPTATADYADKGYDQILTKTNRVESPYAIGSSLLWLPTLIILRALAAAGQLVTALPGYLSGFEWYFTLTISTFSALLGFLAFWIGYLVAFPETSKFSALAASLTLLVATPLLYYQFYEPLYSHASSAFTSGMVVYLWWRFQRQKPTYEHALLIGGAIGLSALVRWQNIIYLVLPLVTTIWWWLDCPPPDRRLEWKRALIYAGVLGFATLAVLSLQLSHWRLLYGSVVTVPQGSAYVDWAGPFWKQVLFSPFRGLLAWMPVTFLAVLGLLLMARKRPRLVIPMLILLLLTLYVNSSSRDWFGGGGYGPRRFSSELAFLIVGYSGLIQAFPKRVRKAAAAILGLVLFLHQWILLRFGLEEDIGGRVMSMYPEYRWSEVTYGEFIKSMSSHISDIFTSPRNFFIQPHSPIADLLNGRWPGIQIYTLLLAISALTLIWLLISFIHKQAQGSKTNNRVVVIAIVVLILGANIWILNWA